jgi:bla regulator protein blaR1
MNQGIMNLMALGNHLWQSTIFALFAWLLVRVFRKNSARVRYWIWMLASLKFLFPLSLLVALGSHLSGPAKQYVVAVDVPAIGFLGLPFGSNPFQKEFLAMATATSEPDPSPNQSATRGVVAIWLLGVGAVLASRLVRVRRVREILSTARQLEDGREIEAIERVKSRRGLTRKVRWATTESVIEPGIHGIFRPTLVLPSRLTELLDAGQLDAIVDHEVCHVRWYDNLSALIHMSVETIFWFHPLVWWMGTRLVDEREQACDEEALENGGDPQVYASAILKVCEYYVASPVECVPGVSGGNLKKRIERIIENRSSVALSAPKRLALAIAGIMAFSIPIVIGVANAPVVVAQSTTVAMPKFEVASIRPERSLPMDPFTLNLLRHMGDGMRGGRFEMSAPLTVLIQLAYKVKDLQVVGGPSWVSADWYHITAQAEGNATFEQMLPMLQSLLAERFKLTLQRETRELPVYELVPARSGLKITPAKAGSCVSLDPSTPPPQLDPNKPFTPCGGVRRSVINPPPDRQDRIEAWGLTMAKLTGILSDEIGPMVVDKTSFKEVFDVRLEFAPNVPLAAVLDAPATSDPGKPALAANPSGPSIFTAVQEQLGLSLLPSKGPVETLVISRVERPSDN